MTSVKSIIQSLDLGKFYRFPSSIDIEIAEAWRMATEKLKSIYDALSLHFLENYRPRLYGDIVLAVIMRSIGKELGDSDDLCLIDELSFETTRIGCRQEVILSSCAFSIEEYYIHQLIKMLPNLWIRKEGPSQVLSHSTGKHICLTLNGVKIETKQIRFSVRSNFGDDLPQFDGDKIIDPTGFGQRMKIVVNASMYSDEGYTNYFIHDKFTGTMVWLSDESKTYYGEGGLAFRSCMIEKLSLYFLMGYDIFFDARPDLLDRVKSIISRRRFVATDMIQIIKENSDVSLIFACIFRSLDYLSYITYPVLGFDYRQDKTLAIEKICEEAERMYQRREELIVDFKKKMKDKPFDCNSLESRGLLLFSWSYIVSTRSAILDWLRSVFDACIEPFRYATIISRYHLLVEHIKSDSVDYSRLKSIWKEYLYCFDSLRSELLDYLPSISDEIETIDHCNGNVLVRRFIDFYSKKITKMADHSLFPTGDEPIEDQEMMYSTFMRRMHGDPTLLIVKDGVVNQIRRIWKKMTHYSDICPCHLWADHPLVEEFRRRIAADEPAEDWHSRLIYDYLTTPKRSSLTIQCFIEQIILPRCVGNREKTLDACVAFYLDRR